MYAYILFLNLIRRLFGSLNTLTAMVYLSVSQTVRDLGDKQITRILNARDKEVQKAKDSVVAAARQVIALEANVAVVEQSAAEKAFKKQVKVEKLK